MLYKILISCEIHNRKRKKFFNFHVDILSIL